MDCGRLFPGQILLVTVVAQAPSFPSPSGNPPPAGSPTLGLGKCAPMLHLLHPFFCVPSFIQGPGNLNSTRLGAMAVESEQQLPKVSDCPLIRRAMSLLAAGTRGSFLRAQTRACLFPFPAILQAISYPLRNPFLLKLLRVASVLELTPTTAGTGISRGFSAPEDPQEIKPKICYLHGFPTPGSKWYRLF